MHVCRISNDITYLVPVICPSLAISCTVPGRPEAPRTAKKNGRFPRHSGLPGTARPRGREHTTSRGCLISRVVGQILIYSGLPQTSQIIPGRSLPMPRRPCLHKEVVIGGGMDCHSMPPDHPPFTGRARQLRRSRQTCPPLYIWGDLPRYRAMGCL